MTHIAVIIPYLQKKPGILRRALTSILQQRLPDAVSVDVIVIDDGSPVPARDETKDLDFPAPFHLAVLEQTNAGVAAARNAGLRQMNAGTTYIAFLDSDDVWEPDHLAQALALLDKGFDLYFCDNKRIGQYESQMATLADGNFLALTKAQVISDAIYELDREAFFKCCLRTFVCQLSTVVYRHTTASDLLFEASLHTAGEDSLFMLQLAARSRRICCATKIGVNCDIGINIYYSKLSWDNPGHLIRYMGIILMFDRFLQQISLTPEDREYVLSQRTNRRHDFAFLTARYFLKKHELWPVELVKMTRHDPNFWRWYPLSLCHVLLRFPLGLYAPYKE